MSFVMGRSQGSCLNIKQRGLNFASIFFCLILFSNPCCAEYCPCEPTFAEKTVDWVNNFFVDVGGDYGLYYSRCNLPAVGVVLFAAGIMANTSIDRSVNRFWQKNIRGPTADGFFRPQESISEFSYIKVYAAAVAATYWNKDDNCFSYLLYHWGYRSMRAWLIVSPQITLLRNYLGGGRPYYKNDCDGTRWKFGHYGRPSCSGHTFNGALPFITAAMMTEYRPLKYGLYFLSVLPGLARINFCKHSLSQVFLGWTLSYLAASTVDYADCLCDSFVKVGVTPQRDGAMFCASIQF